MQSQHGAHSLGGRGSGGMNGKGILLVGSNVICSGDDDDDGYN